jgi:bifunctional non-homologous end joining protein LigD
MTAMNKATKFRRAAGTQLELYRFADDCAAVFETTEGRVPKLQRTAEEICARNRAAAAQLLFVIKKHHATRLHYDLRLEWNMVMVSWAIPEGPSFYPEDRREAIQVEDHAREYAGFEGVIPPGRPGAGPVMLWDSGIWQLRFGSVDVDAAFREGILKFTMSGTKMKGDWTLVRTAKRQGDRQRPIWLLTKDDDEFARASDDADILKEAPNSVLTGKSLEETAQDWMNGKKKSTSQADLFSCCDDEWSGSRNIS